MSLRRHRLDWHSGAWQPLAAVMETPACAEPWTCPACTYRHDDDEAAFLSCAMCGGTKTAEAAAPAQPLLRFWCRHTLHTTEMRLHRRRADTCRLDRSRALRRQGSPSLLPKAAKLQSANPICGGAATPIKLHKRTTQGACRESTDGPRRAPGTSTSRFAIVCFSLCESCFVISLLGRSSARLQPATRQAVASMHRKTTALLHS